MQRISNTPMHNIQVSYARDFKRYFWLWHYFGRKLPAFRNNWASDYFETL